MSDANKHKLNLNGKLNPCRINASLNQISGRISSADTVVDVATVEFRFGAIVLIEKLVFNLAYEKICVAG